MSGELLLINPRKRKSKSSRSAARKRKNKTRHVAGYYPNPHKRGHGRRRNPVRALSRYRRRRRNPISLRGFGVGGLVGQVTNAAMGAAGAIAVDAAYTYIPTPAFLKTGPVSLATKAALALAVGYLGGMVVGKARGARMAEGALTVLAYGALKPLVSSVMPLSGGVIEGLGYYNSGMILQNSLSPLTPLNQGTPLQAYISGVGGDGNESNGVYDASIGAYIS